VGGYAIQPVVGRRAFDREIYSFDYLRQIPSTVMANKTSRGSIIPSSRFFSVNSSQGLLPAFHSHVVPVNPGQQTPGCAEEGFV